MAERGIRVNTLSLGPIDTPMFDSATTAAPAGLVAQIPRRRWGVTKKSPPLHFFRLR